MVSPWARGIAHESGSGGRGFETRQDDISLSPLHSYKLHARILMKNDFIRFAVKINVIAHRAF